MYMEETYAGINIVSLTADTILQKDHVNYVGPWEECAGHSLQREQAVCTTIKTSYVMCATHFPSL